MAPDGGHNGTEGWGQYLHYSFDSSKVRVNNSAYAGRSARTFTREGRFQRIFDQTKPGDWAVIEFGHNDEGDPATDTKYRVDCPGMGDETCPVTYNNQTEIVQTYVTYLLNATATFLSLGTRVIISSPTPNNPYEFGNYSWAPSIYEYYSWYVAEKAGGPSKGVYYVNHGDYGAQALRLMGKDVADANYPMDHTHTAPWLADVFARAFVLGLKCGTAPLQGCVVNATSRIEGALLGTCEGVNSTLPI
ncbi:Rhamnogalacturonan acetylesterase [Pleurostoma richardsiae]|uniref:Rhamnogalacturonan acetylesterase n=1 Tax=Pleurostoma richardsiae TaxID=41990 RepID=A0AA38RYK5_9PEZI|nr:Rhamnogalacturonan acetylesterase [Pleurostoma richardsiae]